MGDHCTQIPGLSGEGAEGGVGDASQVLQALAEGLRMALAGQKDG